jgi:hypothetical protein
MAHFAQVQNGRVVQCIVVNNEDCGNLEFPESEPIGQQFLLDNGFGTGWVQTSYNNNFRVKFGTDGMMYDEELDFFYHPEEYTDEVQP